MIEDPDRRWVLYVKISYAIGEGWGWKPVFISRTAGTGAKKCKKILTFRSKIAALEHGDTIYGRAHIKAEPWVDGRHRGDPYPVDYPERKKGN